MPRLQLRSCWKAVTSELTIVPFGHVIVQVRLADDPREHIMTVTGIITAIVVGLVIGALGRLVVPGKQNIPIWLTMAVGIIAALIGTAIARGLGVADTRGFDWIELIIQVVLAAIGVTIAANAYGRRGIRR
jgi:uncharacterized membrane protein YeaQ/YmgE (transglycosylase-associated protein family)